MKYASGQAPKLADVVKLKAGWALAVIRALGPRGKVKVAWVRSHRPRTIPVKELVLLERSL